MPKPKLPTSEIVQLREDMDSFQAMIQSQAQATKIPDSLAGFSRTMGYENKPFHDEWLSLYQSLLSFILEAPRGHAKSTTGQEYLLWRIVRDPNIRIIIISSTYELASGLAFSLKLQLEARFPWLVKGAAKWGEKGMYVARTDISKDPTIRVASMEGVEPGPRADLIWGDDVVSENNSSSDLQRQKIHKIFNKVLMPMLEPDGGQAILTGTPYHFGDLYATLEKEDGWKLHRYKAIKDDGSALWPERFPLLCSNAEHTGNCCLTFIRQRLGTPIFNDQFLCLGENAPILMGDFNEKPIQDVRIGEEIVGYDFPKTLGHQTRLVKAKVLSTSSRLANIVKITTSSGRILYSTHDHKWFSGKRHRSRDGIYKPARTGNKREASLLVSVYKPQPPASLEEQRDLDWLGGILDGEGSANNVPYIAQSEKANPELCRAIRTTLDRLNIRYKQQAKFNLFNLHGGRNNIIRLVQHARMAKRQRFIEQIWRHPQDIGESTDSVVKIEPAGMAKVYNIHTTTGNYIAYGYASKNCDPSGLVGRLLKLEWLEPYYDTPAGDLEIVQGIDLAISEKETADYTAIVTVGYSPSLQKIYLLNIWRGQVDFPAQLRAIKEQAATFHPSAIVIETNVYQKVLASQLQTTTLLPIMGTVTVKDKIQRVLGNLSPHFESKKLVVRRDMHEFISEYLEFPDGTHDDMLDALEFAVSYIANSAWNKLAQYQGSGAAFGKPKGLTQLPRKDKDRFLGGGDWWLGKDRPGKKDEKK